MTHYIRIPSFISLALAAITLTATASCKKPKQDDANLNQFFENSKRRRANSAEQGMVMRLDNGCTAFAVKNTADKSLIITARHCVDFDPKSWCANGGGLTDNFGNSGRCTQIIASTVAKDVMMFESDIDVSKVQGLRLASFVPQKSTRLTMIGYPADNYAKGQLTVTENCWILETEVRENGHKYKTDKTRITDRIASHNCSTYGGNSGGPMILKGSDIVVGLPYSYMPDDYKPRSKADTRTAATMARIEEFVKTHGATLKKFGVAIANNQSDKAPDDSANRKDVDPDSANRDSANRDSSNRDSSNRDSSNRDSSNRDSSNRDSSNRDSSNRDSSNRDSANRSGEQTTMLDCNRDYSEIMRGGSGVCLNRSSGYCYRYGNRDVSYNRGPTACTATDSRNTSNSDVKDTSTNTKPTSSQLDCNRDYMTIRSGGTGICLNTSSGNCYRYSSGDVRYELGRVQCP
jgi:V8-like Glu-specific endopeptidase